MINVQGLCALVALSLTSSPLFARAGGMHAEDPYNPQHIEGLPPEIHSAIFRKCDAPKAMHPFARYFDHSERIILHFENFRCDGDGTYCGPTGCLHQVWVSSGGRYRLMRSYYGSPRE